MRCACLGPRNICHAPAQGPQIVAMCRPRVPESLPRAGPGSPNICYAPAQGPQTFTIERSPTGVASEGLPGSGPSQLGRLRCCRHVEVPFSGGNQCLQMQTHAARHRCLFPVCAQDSNSFEPASFRLAPASFEFAPTYFQFVRKTLTS